VLFLVNVKYVKSHINTTGAERGSSEEQGFGALAEIVVRNQLGLDDIKGEDHPLAFDILLPSGIKADIKCRGGSLKFQEGYISNDGLPREAKHNFFARQVYDDNLDTDIYILTHLETPADRILPGTARQRKWNLYLCGWVSKTRVKREGVYLPRGSLTEQGRTWFTYRGQEIEFYNRNLNGFSSIRDILTIDKYDVAKDEAREGGLNLTTVDAIRIIYDLIGRGILTEKQLEYVQAKSGFKQDVKPILHPNQYFHLLKWLKKNDQITTEQFEHAFKRMTEEHFEGI